MEYKDKILNEIDEKNDFLKKSLDFVELKNNQEKQFILKICDIGLMKYREFFTKNGEYSPDLYLDYLSKIRDYIYDSIYKKDFIELNDILGLHEVIMYPIKSFENIENIGKLREKPIFTREKNYLKGLNEAFISHYKVEKKTIETISNYNNRINSAEESKIPIITELYMNFLAKIHIFENGNGRIMFILLDILLLKNNYLPIFIRHHENLRDKISEDYIVHRNINKLQIDLYKTILDIYSNYQIK